MAAVSPLRYAFLAYAAKPRAERVLYRRIKRHKLSRIVEIGVGDLARSRRLIEVAQRFTAEPEVRYAAVDRFDDRPEGLPRLPLIELHRDLARCGARVRLVPGSIAAGVGSVANCLADTDLIVIGYHVDESQLEEAWFYLPRMLHAGSLVFREAQSADGSSRLYQMSMFDIEQRSAGPVRRRAAA